jgi:hypothetical protein
MEAEMNKAGFEQPGPSNEPNSDRNSQAQEIVQPDTAVDDVMTSRLRAEKLSIEIDRFSGLSSELTAILTLFSQEIKTAAEQLNRIRAAVDLKKKELKDLHGIEASVAALDRLAVEHQGKKEALERLMADQRAQWEVEKARRTREEKEYAENLRIRREREEEESRQRVAGEKLKAQQKLEEEMRILQQEGLQKQQALERDCLERELILKEKELEWVQLIQELEQFMSKLTRRTQGQSAARFGSVAAESIAPPAAQKAATPERQGQKDPDSDDITLLREMLVTQGQKIENLKQ